MIVRVWARQGKTLYVKVDVHIYIYIYIYIDIHVYIYIYICVWLVKQHQAQLEAMHSSRGNSKGESRCPQAGLSKSEAG